jgi:hypothetical protein
MLDEVKSELRFANDLPAEAGFSTNLFLNHPITGRQQFTFRGVTSTDWGDVLKDVGRFLQYMQEKGWKFDGERAEVPAVIPQASAPTEPTRQAIDDSGNALPEVKTFTAEKLSVSMNDGKYYYKVIGRPFTQYGVPVWDEVLAAANLDVREGQPVPNIAGWKADYIETMKDDKKRMKVIRLLPPK